MPVENGEENDSHQDVVECDKLLEKLSINDDNNEQTHPSKREVKKSVDVKESVDTNETEKPKKIDGALGGISCELVPRGPVSCRDTSNRIHPYSPSNSSVSSLSELSQGSPASCTNDARYSMYGGGSILLETRSSSLELLESSTPRVVNNKQRYIHQTGGNVQLVQVDPKLPSDGQINGHNGSMARSPLTNGTPTLNFSGRILLSPASSDSSGCWTGADSSPEAETAGSEVESFDNSSCDSSLPDYLAEFINDGLGDFRHVDSSQYQEKIADIMNVMNGVDCQNNGGGSSRHFCSDDLDNAVDICVLDSPHDQVTTTEALCQPVLNGNGVRNVVYQYVSHQVKDKGSSSKPFRPIAPKPVVEVKQDVSVHPLDQRRRVNHVPMEFEDILKLRNSLLEKFSNEQRRVMTCWSTRMSDEEVTKADKDGDTCLHVAIANHNTLPSVLLTDRFAEMDYLNIRSREGQTPLFYAMVTEQISLFRYLLAKGADPNANTGKHNCIKTLLHCIAESGEKYLEFLKILCLHPDTDLDKYNHLGQTPLLVAIANHNKCFRFSSESMSKFVNTVPVIQMLCRNNASMTCQDRHNGKNIYHLAVEKKNVSLLKVICQENPNTIREINIPAFDGNTALHVAATLKPSQNQKELIKVLISFKASLTSENLEHKKPCELVDKHNKELKKMLAVPHH